MKKYSIVLVSFLLFVFILSGCTATTTIRSIQPGVSLKIKDKSYVSTPVNDAFPVTTFGNYEFAAELKGRPPLYGILPLQVNAGNLVLDILLFAPACLFNLREVYPYYEIDVDKAFIRYSSDSDNWYDLQIANEESDQAKLYFGAIKIANYGEVLVFNKGELFYTPTVSINEVNALGNYLVHNGFFDGNRKTVQINKVADLYELRVVVRKGVENDPAMIIIFKSFAHDIAKAVFNNSNVTLHLCDENLQTLSLVTM